MAKLIYSAITSLDGYVADEDGDFDWAEPDEDMHTFVERPGAAGRHLPLRAPDVRGNGRLGEPGHRRRPAALHARLRGDMEGGRQDRVLHDAGVGIKRRRESSGIRP